MQAIDTNDEIRLDIERDRVQDMAGDEGARFTFALAVLKISCVQTTVGAIPWTAFWQ